MLRLILPHGFLLRTSSGPFIQPSSVNSNQPFGALIEIYLLLHSLVQLPVLMSQWEDLLVRPQNQELHPLRFKMKLAAWVVSGNPSQTREFLLKLTTLSVQTGQQVQKNSTKLFSNSGGAGAVKGMSIPFRHMFHKC